MHFFCFISDIRDISAECLPCTGCYFSGVFQLGSPDITHYKCKYQSVYCRVPRGQGSPAILPSLWLGYSSISRMSSMVKVIVQRSRSPGWETWFLSNFTHLVRFGWPNTMPWSIVWCFDIMWRHRLTSLGRRDYEIFRRGRCVNVGAFSFLEKITLYELSVNIKLHILVSPFDIHNWLWCISSDNCQKELNFYSLFSLVIWFYYLNPLLRTR